MHTKNIAFTYILNKKIEFDFYQIKNKYLKKNWEVKNRLFT